MSKNPHENCYFGDRNGDIQVLDSFGKLELEYETKDYSGECTRTEIAPIEFCPFCGERSKTKKEDF